MSLLFSTFWIADRLYGIPVDHVQEVTRPMPMTRIPLAPDYAKGLINLRGQIATAIDLRRLFRLSGDGDAELPMNVICDASGFLLSLAVDRIGDVIEVEASQFAESPDTLPGHIRSLMTGVYKTKETLLSVLSVEKISAVIQQSTKPGASLNHT